MRTAQTRSFRRSSLPAQGLSSYHLGLGRPINFTRIIGAATCLAPLLTLRAVGAEYRLQGSRTELLQSNRSVACVGKGTATYSTRQTGHGSTAAAHRPFIRPISPMPPLFPKDDLLRIPWSEFGFNRTSARSHVRLPTTSHKQVLRSVADFRSSSGSSILSPHKLSGSGPPVSSSRSIDGIERQDSVPPLISHLGALPQTGISPARATQIQAALVVHGYLTGAPTGSWDAPSVAAMRRLQSDHHWQTKFMPDSRALIFLGLGPRNETP